MADLNRQTDASFSIYEALATPHSIAPAVQGYALPESLAIVRSINQATRNTDLSKFGFDKDPFAREYQNPNDGVMARAWHGLQSAFGSAPTLESKLHDQAVQNLTGAQRREYEHEKEEMLIYDTRMSLEAETPPAMPIHDQVNQTVEKEEKQIEEQVFNSLTPQQQEQLVQERRTYKQDLDKALSHNQPFGYMGDILRTPTKGPTLKYFESMVQQKTEQQLGVAPNS